jgi:outer membrane protein, multidrug efflux system
MSGGRNAGRAWLSPAAAVVLLAAAVLLAAELDGCAVGPDYHPPPLPAGAQAPLVTASAAGTGTGGTPGPGNARSVAGGTPGAVAAAVQPPDAWWQLYHDALLDRLIGEALQANTDLRVATANLAAARALLLAAKAGRYPRTTVEAAGVYGRDPVTDEILEIGRHEPENLWLYDAVLDASYEVDLFGRVRRSIEAARADAEGAVAVRDTVRVSVAAETVRAYAQVCALGEQLAVARHSAEVVAHEEQITRSRSEAGAASEFDVVRAEGLTQQVRAAIAPLAGARRAALLQLTALLGRTPVNAPAEAEACVAPPQLDSPLPVGDGRALLARRPDVRAAERQLAAATARIGVATADLYPRIVFNAFAGGAATELNQLFTNDGLAWGVGPGVSWSFPNQAPARARLRQARAGAEGALAGFDSAVLQALKETAQDLAAYQAELDHRQGLLAAQERAARAFAMAHEQFIAGALSDLELLTAEQALVGADAAVAASDAALVQDQIALFKALGGGWK